MKDSRFRKYLPDPARLRNSRYLKPFARHLDRHYLWQFNRKGVAGGVAVGMFFGILAPFMQIFLAAVAAILLRVNLPAAALSTLVSNPLTFPPLYYLAFEIGNAVTGFDMNASGMDEQIAYVAGLAQAEPGSRLANLLEWARSVGPPLAAGLGLLACGGALAGFLAVQLVWRAQVWRRQRRRHRNGRRPE